MKSQCKRSAGVPLFLTFTFGFTWILWLPVMLASQGFFKLLLPGEILLLAGTFGPSLAAFTLTFSKEGTGGIRRLFMRGLDVGFSLRMFVFIVATPIIVAAVAYWLAGGSHPVLNPLIIFPNFILYFFLGGSLAEEFGWRGYALPRLQRRFGALPSALILGAIWSAWHLPLFWMHGTSQSVTPLWIYFAFVTALSVIYTWVYNRTNGSILAALLMHTATNITVVMFPPPTQEEDISMYFAAAGLWLIAASLILFAGPRLARSRASSNN